MEFDHDNVRQVLQEDRLSNLPDELIHKILSCFDMKFAVQTCLLSSRWKLLWTSMPCLNFSSYHFGNLPKFAKFVTKVLSHRNHQVEVSSVNLDFNGAASQVFVRKIANYAFSHNVQELTVSIYPKKHHQFPLCLFSSQSLKHFTLSNGFLSFSPRITPTTPWDFPALTTMHLSDITLCDDYTTAKSVDLFSKCVNLKKLTLESFIVKAIDIITPRLSTLTLIDCIHPFVINLVAPQLENLTVIKCSIKYLNAPPGLSTFCYRGHLPQQLSKEGFHSLNEVTFCLNMYYSHIPYKEEDVLKTINMLQELHTARYLTLNVDIVECLSSFPDLLSHHPSPFSNLICLTIDSSKRKDAYKVKMSTEARNFFLENSPNATFIMELPEPPPTKAMKQKEARAKKAKRAAEIATHMKELQASIDHEKMNVERKLAKEKAIAAVEKLMAEIKVQAAKEHSETQRLLTQLKSCLEEMRPLVNEEKAQVAAIISKEGLIKSFLQNLHYRERTQVEARYSQLLEETQEQCVHLVSEIVNTQKFLAFEKPVSHFLSIYSDVFSSKPPLASQAPSSSSATIPSINPMP